MKSYSSVSNLFVNGDEFTEGFLGLDWFPSKSASQKKATYENETLKLLDKLEKTGTGWCVINEIKMLNPRKMTIVPFHPTAKDKYNAYAMPTDWEGATLKQTKVRDNDGKTMPTYQVTGSGKGSDCLLSFSPGTWAPGSGAPVGPGASADEILLHEMVHGIRQMAGRMNRFPVDANPGMDNYEEFAAIVISNMYRAETGATNFRSDHHGFTTLAGPTATVAGFKTAFSGSLSGMSIEQPRLCANLRKMVTATFNPFL